MQVVGGNAVALSTMAGMCSMNGAIQTNKLFSGCSSLLRLICCCGVCSAMERQHVQDKDAWKKNTIAQLKETRDRMQKLSENQLETLTKRTILENEAMAAELKYQSRQVRLQSWSNLI